MQDIIIGECILKMVGLGYKELQVGKRYNIRKKPLVSNELGASFSTPTKMLPIEAEKLGFGLQLISRVME